MKFFALGLLFTSYTAISKAQFSTGFNSYTGPGTGPIEWTIANGSSNNTYTTVGNYGLSVPSVRLDATNETITTPVFSSATGIKKFGAGQSVTGASAITVQEFVGGAWTTIIVLTADNSSGNLLQNASVTYGVYPLSSGATRARIVYTKVGGNMAIDDLEIIGAVLPLDRINFKSETANNSVRLTWNVSPADSLQSTIVEKSTDGQTFTTLPTNIVKNGTTFHIYDNNPAAKNYYRLKIKQANSNILFSKILKVNHHNDAYITCSAVYTGIRNQLRLAINSNQNGNALLTVYTTNKKRVATKSFTLNNCTNTVDISQIKNRSNTYIIVIQLADKKYSFKASTF